MSTQNQFIENWNKFYQCMNKPLLESTQLTLNTLNNLSKNTGTYEEMTQAKKPDEFLWVQLKLANYGNLEALTYTKKLNDIWLDAITEMNSICSDMLRETTKKTTDMVKSASKSKD